MPKCDVCGNDYDKAFQVTQTGRTMTFDSFLATATGAWVVSPDAFERILMTLAAGKINLSLLPPLLLVLALSLTDRKVVI